MYLAWSVHGFHARSLRDKLQRLRIRWISVGGLFLHLLHLERQLAISQTYEAQARGVVAQYVRLTLGDVPEVLSKASLQGELGYGREEQSLATGKGPLPFLFWVLRNWEHLFSTVLNDVSICSYTYCQNSARTIAFILRLLQYFQYWISTDFHHKYPARFLYILRNCTYLSEITQNRRFEAPEIHTYHPLPDPPAGPPGSCGTGTHRS